MAGLRLLQLLTADDVTKIDFIAQQDSWAYDRGSGAPLRRSPSAILQVTGPRPLRIHPAQPKFDARDAGK